MPMRCVALPAFGGGHESVWAVPTARTARPLGVQYLRKADACTGASGLTPCAAPRDSNISIMRGNRGKTTVTAADVSSGRRARHCGRSHTLRMQIRSQERAVEQAIER